MAHKKKNSQLMKEGDSKKVIIENVTNGCVVVSLLHFGQRYYGVLIDTTERQTPFGLLKDEGLGKSDESPKKPCETFPRPLLTRCSYKLNPPQPALPVARRRSCRIRKQNRSCSKYTAFNKCTGCSGLYGNQSKKSTAGPNCAVSGKRYAEAKHLCSELDPLLTSSTKHSSSRKTRDKLPSVADQKTPRENSKTKVNKSPRIIIRYRKPGAGVRVFKIPSKFCDSQIHSNQNRARKVQSTLR